MGARRMGWAAFGLAGVLLASPAFGASAEGLPAGLKTRATKDGLVLVDAAGQTLYRIDLDRYMKRWRGSGIRADARCTDTCAKLWRPAAPPAGFKPGGDWEVVERPGAGPQLSYKGDPLYVFNGKSLEEAKLPVAPAFLSGFTGKPIELKDGVPLMTIYWHEATYQPPAPKTDAPSGVGVSWAKTSYVYTAGDRPLYARQARGGCTDGCDGLEPLVAPMAALPVGAWRPTEDKSGRRFWAYRGQLVYASRDAKAEPQSSAWRKLEVR